MVTEEQGEDNNGFLSTKIKIFTRNVRGVNNLNKRRIVRSLIQQWGVDVNIIYWRGQIHI